MILTKPKIENIEQEEVNSNYDLLVFGNEEEHLDYKISQCCNAIPGDNVFGFVTINEGIKVHKKDCPNAISLQANYAYRIISAKWIDSTKQEFIRIVANVTDKNQLKGKAILPTGNELPFSATSKIKDKTEMELRKIDNPNIDLQMQIQRFKNENKQLRNDRDQLRNDNRYSKKKKFFF